jgi:NUMOD3 motif
MIGSNYRKHPSEETRAKMIQALMRPEIREKNRLAHLGTKASEETRSKMRLSRARWWARRKAEQQTPTNNVTLTF